MDSTLSGSILIDELLQTKALEPLPEVATAELKFIQDLDITAFSEAEVRAYIIDPIVRVLGYAKGSVFSVDLEKKIAFLKKDKFIDYKLTLWEENFWLIEAKKPQPRPTFAYDDLKQAVEYAIHPNINAALVVLCDGQKLEVFDREVSLSEPVLHIDRSNLITEFDKVRLLLEPWQIWFFQKRRILRLLDKVFDKEFNLARVAEFKSIIDRRLDSKRSVVLENFRAQIKSDDEMEKTETYLRNADPIDLIDVHFFLQHSTRATKVMIVSLVECCKLHPYHVTHQIFPDCPRDTNDMFYMHALWFLMEINKKNCPIHWLPAWLNGSERKLEKAIQRLIALSLSSFVSDQPRKIILLAATALRRICKILSISSEEQWRAGQLFHAIERHFTPELSWRQITASPPGHILQKLNTATLQATSHFVKDCRDERGEFLPQTARSKLIELWNVEKALLTQLSDYDKLKKERSLGELYPTEASNIVYDNLGHSCLCVINFFPDWKAYALTHHRLEIETIAAFGSWQAQELLGIKGMTNLPPPHDAVLADRFFFGDIKTLKILKEAYNF